MNTISVILSTYFRNHFFAVLVLLIALILWLTGIGMSVVKGGESLEMMTRYFLFFLFPLCAVTYISGLNLRRLLLTDAGALYPKYRQKQLIALGIILFLFMMVPLVLMGMNGFPILKATALFGFLVAIILWATFNFGENPLLLAVFLWLGALAYEVLEFKSRFIIFGTFEDFTIMGSKVVFPLVLAVVSLAGILLFARYFLVVQVHKVPVSIKKDESGFTAAYDKAGPITMLVNNKKLGRLLTRPLFPRQQAVGDKKQGSGPLPKSSIYRMARLIQPSLFSPIFSNAVMTIGLYIGASLPTITYVYIRHKEKAIPVEDSRLLILVYIFMGIFFTADFLMHRHRLPALWMQLPLNSRKRFVRTVMASYLIVAGKMAVMSSLAIIIFAWISPVMTVYGMLPLIMVGFMLTAIMTAHSLLMSGSIRTPDSKGWMIGSSIFYGYFIFFIVAVSKIQFTNTTGTWYFIGVLAAFSLILMWAAYRKWKKTELSFLGPEQVMS
jgi:ABC-type multidrug transport system fused ATPase/permease subunit